MTSRSGADRPVLIGITGPIGCGKSTVARLLAELGGTVIDADRLAREVTAPGAPTLPLIRQRFGDAVFSADGSLDRAAMAAVVFDDAAALADLESIIHPAVRRRLVDELAEATESGVPFAAVEAIKLVEGGLADDCDEVWIVDCPPDVQRRRILERGGDPDDMERRLRVQGDDLSERLEKALDGRVPVRRLASDVPLAEMGEIVESALADLLST